jgi:hypothetical protein
LFSLLWTFQSRLALQLVYEVLEERRCILVDTGSTAAAYLVRIDQVFAVAQAMNSPVNIPNGAVK